MTAIARLLGLTCPLILFAQQAPSPEPVIPLLQPDTTDPLERVRRDARANVFHTCAQPLPLTLGPGKEFEQLAIATPSRMPQLPVAESDVVVAGQVTGLKVFLSANKKCLYTEYTFKVEDVGKPGVGIIAGDEIAILALGGVAKLPTGGILRMEIRGVPRYPVVGGRYLMFLIAEPAPSDAYAAIKYWNIDGDSVLFAHECVGSPSRQDKTPPSKKLLADVMFTIKAAK